MVRGKLLAVDRAQLESDQIVIYAREFRQLHETLHSLRVALEQKDRHLEQVQRELAASQRALAAIQQMTDAIVTSRELQRLLGALLDTVVQSLDLRAGAILTFDNSRQHLCVRAVSTSRPYAQPPCSDGLAKDQNWLRPNLAHQVAALGIPLTARSGDGALPYSESVLAAYGVRSVLAAPLRGRGEVVGVAELGAEMPRRFSPAEVKLVEAMAERAATAIENDALHQELRGKEEQVSLLLRSAIDAQEAERERICLDLHDGVAQTLAAAFQYQQLLESQSELAGLGVRSLVLKVSALVQTALRETREVISTLRPTCLDTEGLVATLRKDLENLQAQTGWHVRFEADSVRFPRPVETALYRIVHEAVNNARKHSQTDRLDVRLRHANGAITVEVTDYGVGFDLARLHSGNPGKRVGLLSMRRRAELLQGRCDVQSTPGLGTTVNVEVPLSRCLCHPS